MKITFVVTNPSMSGGVRVIATHARNLMDRGHDVLVVANPPRPLHFRKKAAIFFHGGGWPKYSFDRRSHLDTCGVPYQFIPKYGPLTDRDFPDADIIVATWWLTAEWVAPLSPVKGIKTYFIQHHEIWGGNPARVDATWRLPLHKIVISKWLKDLARDRFGDSEASHVPNSVDTTLFNAPPREKQHPPTVGMLYAGNHFKGCDVSLKAFAQVREASPETKFVSFGAHPPKPELPLPVGAQYTVNPAQDKIKDLYAQCDVWLCGSRSEGFHLPPLEAMACRCPVVSTKVGGPLDTIEDGKNGFLTDVEDHAALADRLLRVLNLSDQEWRKMSDAAYATACRYTWQDAAQLLEQAFETAIGRFKAARPRWRIICLYNGSIMVLSVYLAMIGWIPLTVGLFLFLPGRTAVIYSYLIAFLFLSMATVRPPGFVQIDKFSESGSVILLCALLFDSKTVFAFRPKIWDIPAFIWCICPFFSSAHNGFGTYNGAASIFYQVCLWGFPYLIGRIYFTDLAALRELAVGVVIGGLLYVPLCAYEIRFSPQLHHMIYGFAQHDFAQTRRGNWFRPMVFMQHGLAVGMWMAATALTAFCLAWSKAVKYIWGIPMWAVALILIATTVACQSMGSIALLFGAIVMLTLTQWIKRPILILLLIAGPIIYMGARASGAWTGEALVTWLHQKYPDRANSLAIRLKSENLFVEKAQQSLIFGWSGWDNFRPKDENGNDVGAIPDGLWVITLAKEGLVGLSSLTLVFLLPPLLLIWKIPSRYWMHPGAAPAAAMAVILCLSMCDNLMNAMPNPIFILAAGGLTGMAFSLRRQSVPAESTVPQRSLVTQSAHMIAKA